MKKLIFGVLFAAIVAVGLVPWVQAEFVEVDGLSYSVVEKPAENDPGILSVYKYTGDETHIVIPSEVTTADGTYSVTAIESSAFKACTSLISVTIPDGVASIGTDAFFECTSLESVNIPYGVTSIGGGSFAYCTSLTNIALPDGVTSIGASAFHGCDSLASVNIPDSVTNIGENAFMNTSITSITIPSGVTSISGWLFADCIALTDVTLSSGITSIERQAFEGCTALTNITIPDSVTSIGENAFYCCSSLTGITLPSGITSVGAYAFYGCEKLESLDLPRSLTSIGEKAFDCQVNRIVDVPTDLSDTKVFIEERLHDYSGILRKVNNTFRFTGGTMTVTATDLTDGLIIEGGSLIFDERTEDIVSLTFVNDEGEPLYLNTVTPLNFNGTKQTYLQMLLIISDFDESAICDYGMVNVTTDQNGKLYLWLPEGTSVQMMMDITGSMWQYNDGDDSTTKDVFVTGNAPADIVLEPYLNPGTTFPFIVDIQGFPNAQGFFYGRGSDLSVGSRSLNVGEKGKNYYFMIDSDIDTPGINPLPEGYTISGLYLNEQPPASGSYSVSDKFDVGNYIWTQGSIYYGGPTYQFVMPEESANITAVVSGQSNPTVKVNGVNMIVGMYLPTQKTSSSSLTQTRPQSGYAYMYYQDRTPVLELNEASFTDDGIELISNAENSRIIIKLIGENEIAGAGSGGSAGLFDAYESTRFGGTDITFTGSGSLTATGTDISSDGNISAGISGGGSITVESGVTLFAAGGKATGSGGASYGIRAAGVVTLGGNITASGDYGVMTAVGNIDFVSGTLTSSGNIRAVQPGLGGSFTVADSIIKVGQNAADAANWDTKTALTNYKYIYAAADVIAPVLQAGDVNRTDDSSACVCFTSSEPGQYYYAIAESGAQPPVIDTSSPGTACDTREQSILLTSLSPGAKDIYIIVKDEAGNISDALKISIAEYKDVLYGDVTGEGDINISDAIFLSQLLAGDELTPTLQQSAAADVEFDGTLNISDLIKLSRYLANDSINLGP